MSAGGWSAWVRLQGALSTRTFMSRAVVAGRRIALNCGNSWPETLVEIMPNHWLGPTLEEVQVWLRSAPDWVQAGFVLNVEAVNARLGRVLVVEDDPGIATQLVRGLTRAGYETGSVTTGKAALDWPVPDVVLLDLGLPDIDGIEVCRRLRQSCDAAIIIVTARGEEADRVLALDEGADDYLIKPFGLQELLARIRAVLRRSRQPAGQVLQHGPLTVDLRTHKVTVSGNQIAVTPKEFAILECLASDPGRVVSRQEMLERAWDEHWYGPTKVLDVHMAALRKKLGDPGLIETVYGHGFRLADQGSPA
jgi:DNA-binding response OmpR family regulator